MSATLTSLDQTLKVKYAPAWANLINKQTVLLDRIQQKKKPFKGKNYTQPKAMSMGGGIGARTGSSPTLPKAGNTTQVDLVANAKKLYARVDIDREAIVAGKKSEQVFIDSTKHEMESKARRFALDLNRQFYGDGNGSLGVLSVNSAGTAITISKASWNENYFMEGDYVTFHADSSGVPGAERTTSKPTDGYVIGAINPSTRTLTMTSAVDASVVATDHIVINDNKGNELTGFAKHIDAQTGTVQGIDKGAYFRARGLYKDALSSTISVDLMNEISELSINRSVMPFTMIMCNPYQWRVVQQLLENSKTYYAKDSDKGRFGFKALEYCSPIGDIPVYADRFCPKDKMYFMNPDCFSLIMREDFGWFDDDGTILMRNANTDSYEARYGGYAELICNFDNANGVLDNLAIS